MKTLSYSTLTKF